MTLTEATRILGGEQFGADVRFSSVSIDSRTLEDGDLFVALRGPSFDGHDYIDQARDKGAIAALVSEQTDTGLPQLRVGDTRMALVALAAAWRARHDIPLAAVTGSNGKTTVKTMLAGILSRLGPVLSTRGNLNNDIGVPLTLLRLDTQHRFGVVEMGASAAGEIAALTRMAQPDVALITNAAPAHLEGFGSLEGVARAKGEIFSGLRTGGCAVLNRDDLFYERWRDGLAPGVRVLTFSLAGDADVSVASRDVKTVIEAGRFVTRFTLTASDGEMPVELHLAGRHNVANALAAATAALALGAGHDVIRIGLESLSPVAGRLNLREGSSGAWVIDDTYNANPASLNAAMEVLAGCGAEPWLVLGDMAELGPDAIELHARAGRSARRKGIRRVFACGELARSTVECFGEGGVFFEQQTALVEALRGQLSAHDQVAVLVKGSRSQHMEDVVSALLPDTSAVRGQVGGH